MVINYGNLQSSNLCWLANHLGLSKKAYAQINAPSIRGIPIPNINTILHVLNKEAKVGKTNIEEAHTITSTLVDIDLNLEA
jgi:hypothetical protein